MRKRDCRFRFDMLWKDEKDNRASGGESGPYCEQPDNEHAIIAPCDNRLAIARKTSSPEAEIQAMKGQLL
jgi:hypothetical protein